ncbi:hypothetical protein [Novosphingobium sp.]|uniref:hypothetical protein n=1 Tax=Novosphingobium sp. TaxID=1874826 RepID=UPI003D150172
MTERPIHQRPVIQARLAVLELEIASIAINVATGLSAVRLNDKKSIEKAIDSLTASAKLLEEHANGIIDAWRESDDW